MLPWEFECQCQDVRVLLRCSSTLCTVYVMYRSEKLQKIVTVSYNIMYSDTCTVYTTVYVEYTTTNSSSSTSTSTSTV